MAGRLDDLRTPSFGSPRLDPAFELSAQSEFVDGSNLYDSLKHQPRMLFNSELDGQSRGRLSSFAGSRERLNSKGRDAGPLEVSFQHDDVIGVAHRPKRFASNRTPELHEPQSSPTNNPAESEADMITRQRLVSQKLLGKKASKGPPSDAALSQQETRQLTKQPLSSQSLLPSKASPSGTNWQSDQILMSQPELTSAPTSGPQPARQDFTPAGPGAFSHPNPQLLQNLLMAQMQQQQLHPMYWPYLQAHQYAPVHASHSSTHQYTPPIPSWPAPPPPAPQKQFNIASKPSYKASPNQAETELRSTSSNWEPAGKDGISTLGEDGAPLEALSDLVAKERASQELIAELKSELEEERQGRQSAEDKNRGLEEALAGARSRERELEDQVVEAVDRARRFEEEGRQAKHRLKEAEKELEATRRKMQEDAEKLVRMKRKDVRLAAEIEKIQARDQAELEALSEERRRLEGDLTELRKLPVVAELLREDNEALRARLQRAEKDRANLQELVGGFRHSTAELEQASKRGNGENEALRKECNMLKLQIASKDTSISQLQVALFAGREERTDLYHKLRKLEEAAQAMEGPAAPSRRGSFGLKTLNPGEAFSITRRLDASFDNLSFGADSFEKLGLETESAAQLGNAESARDKGERSSVRATPDPVPSNLKTERNSRHRENAPGPETLPPAGVFSPAGRNRAQQLAGDDMRRRLTRDRESDRSAVGGTRQTERNPGLNERSSAASEKVPTRNERAGPTNERTASPNERNPLGGERTSGRTHGSDVGRNLSGSDMRQMDGRHVAEPPERARGKPSSVWRESPDTSCNQSRDRPNSPQETVTPPRSPTTERIVASETERRQGPVGSPATGHLFSQPSLGSVHTPPRPHEAVPFATEQSLQEAMEETAAIESKLMEVSLERSQLESEYAKLPQSAGRTMTERRRKQELEGRIEDLTKKIGWLRMELRERHVLHK